MSDMDTDPVLPRFASMGDCEIKKILNDKDSINTKKATDSAVNVLKAYLREKGLSEDFESLSADELDSVLTRFYMEARNRSGDHYKKSTLHSIRNGLKRYLKTVDIVSGAEFRKSREAFEAMTTEQKRQGLGGIDHHSPLEAMDLEKLYQSFSIDNPESLQQKVFVDVLLYFGRRGRENIRDLRISDFACKRDGDGQMFIYIKKDELTKNHRNDANSADGRMYQVQEADERCPVKTFMKYKNMLPRGFDCLFPKLRQKESKEGLWFDRIPMGHNRLGSMMTVLSDKAGLSKRYTNHSLRATSVHLLDSANIPTRHIMTVTGHRAESSLKTYTGYTDSKSKRVMSNTISKGTGIKLSTTGENAQASEGNVNNASAIDPLRDIDIDFSRSDIKPLTDSQKEDILSFFDDDLDDILRKMSDSPMKSVPAERKCISKNVNECQTSNIFTQNHNISQNGNVTTNNMQLPPLPTINASTCNIVVNYNIYQK